MIERLISSENAHQNKSMCSTRKWFGNRFHYWKDNFTTLTTIELQWLSSSVLREDFFASIWLRKRTINISWTNGVVFDQDITALKYLTFLIIINTCERFALVLQNAPKKSLTKFVIFSRLKKVMSINDFNSRISRTSLVYSVGVLRFDM